MKKTAITAILASILISNANAGSNPITYLNMSDSSLFQASLGGIGRCVMIDNTSNSIYDNYAVTINGQQVSGTKSHWAPATSDLRMLISNGSCNFRDITFNHQKYLRMDNAKLWNAALAGIGHCKVIVNDGNLAVSLNDHQIGTTESKQNRVVSQLRRFIGAGICD